MASERLADAPRQRASRIALFLALIAGVAYAAVGGDSAPARVAAQPNILVFITDDQPVGTMSAMPRASQAFGDLGTTYSNAWATTPLCCPSRASIFTGQYAHNHGITVNDGTGFDADNTWQRDLHDGGYLTGIVGKYLNEIETTEAPHFDFTRWWPSARSDDPSLWLSAASEFLAQAESGDARPWALVIAPHSPHGPYNVQPTQPQPIPPFEPSPSFGEEDLGDKHAAVREAALSWDASEPEEDYRGAAAELQATDEKIGGLFRALRSYRESGQRTLAFFISDNGFLRGDHKLVGKKWPYREAIQVPFFVRWPGHVPRGAINANLVANIDIAPTIYEATGITPGHEVDGRSLFGGTQRDALLLELPTGSERTPPWSAYLSDHREYIQWADGSRRFVEDYDLTTDGAQLTASNRRDQQMARWLAAARRCAGTDCP